MLLQRAFFQFTLSIAVVMFSAKSLKKLIKATRIANSISPFQFHMYEAQTDTKTDEVHFYNFLLDRGCELIFVNN